MNVRCELINYSGSKPLDNLKVIVSSAWADCDFAEIEVGDIKFKVHIREMISALNKCELDCFGR